MPQKGWKAMAKVPVESAEMEELVGLDVNFIASPTVAGLGRCIHSSTNSCRPKNG